MSEYNHSSERDGEDDKECVVCGSEEHDGDGWIFPIEDSKVVAIDPEGPERELKDDARPICSPECKDNFEEEME